MDLHGVPPPAARGLDPATVQGIGSSACREACGVDNGGPHGFGARSRGALLGFSDALKIF
jgi:hypothetical protein